MERNEILITYGSDPAAMARQILEAADVASLIGDRHKKIGLKPNLVTASPAENGGTTHPALLAGTIEYLRDNGFAHITVMEGSWVGDRTAQAFRACGYEALAQKYGVPLVDLQKDSFRPYDCAGMEINLCDTAMAMDFVINYPVLKGHCQTNITCSLKNCKGMMPNLEKRRFHTLGLHRPIAHLNTVARTDFILVDGICGDLDFEEGGNPVPMNRVLGARDRVLCDAYACHLMGWSVEDVPYIGMAEALGVGSADVSGAVITQLSAPSERIPAGASGRRVRALAGHVREKDACSACYGSLIHALGRLDEAGELRGKTEKLAIGQGWRGAAAPIGIGSCTNGCARCCTGCPPKADDILRFLRKNWR